MKVSITSIQLRSIWKIASLVFHRMKIKSQSKKAGAIKVTTSGLGILSYTMTLWPDENSIAAFSKSGAHLEALKESRLLAVEICILTIDANNIPSVEKAKELLPHEGKTFRY